MSRDTSPPRPGFAMLSPAVTRPTLGPCRVARYRPPINCKGETVFTHHRYLLLGLIVLAGLLLLGGTAAAQPAGAPGGAPAAALSAGGGLAPLGASCAVPNFGAMATYGVGTTPNEVVTGDFNNDGHPDMAVVNY